MDKINMRPVNIDEFKSAYRTKRGMYAAMLHEFYDSGVECVELEVKGDVTRFCDNIYSNLNHNKELKGKIKCTRRNNRVYLYRAEAMEK